MASLHKDPRGRSPFWYCAFVLGDGKRVFRSTKQTDRKKALNLCRGWEKAAESARAGMLTEAATRKALNDILESVGESPIQTPTVKAFFEGWLTGKQISQKEVTGKIYAKPIRLFLQFLGDKTNKPLGSLSPADIERFQGQRIKDGISMSTVRQDLERVRSVLATARRQGLILHNPAEAVPLPRATPQKREVFTPQDIRALLQAAPPEWNTVIMLGYFCGMRLMDAATVTWDQVEFSDRVIIYRQGKTGQKVEIPMHSQLEEHLLSIAGDRSGPLSPTIARGRTGGTSGLSQQFARLVDKAGIDRRQVQSSKSRRFSALSFHSLRHGFASALANARVTSDERMQLTGHNDAGVHQKYSHLQLDSLRQAIAKVPRIK